MLVFCFWNSDHVYYDPMFYLYVNNKSKENSLSTCYENQGTGG